MKQTQNKPKMGVDLGNTFSSAGTVDKKGNVRFYQNIEGRPEEPTEIFVVSKKEHLYGIAASNSERSDPERSIKYFKRGIDERDKNGKSIPVKILDGKTYTAQECEAMYLHFIKEGMEKQIGESVNEVVVTVPHNFTDTGRQFTHQAAKQAGFEKVKLLDEATAAALAYGVEKEQDGMILISDLGGGTYDVTILEMKSGTFKTLGTAGDGGLGGIDISKAICEMITEEYEKISSQKLDMYADPRLLSELFFEAERVKHTLSMLPKTKSITIIKETRVEMEFTREALEERIKPILDKIAGNLKLAAERANVQFSQIDRVIMVGGSSKVPAVQRVVKEVTGKEPSFDIDPSTAIAHGAALFACIANWDETSDELLDKTPTTDEAKLALQGKIKELHLISAYALGVEALEPEGRTKVLAAVTPPQAEIGKMYERMFKPEAPFQDSAIINILQGIPDKPSEKCNSLGKFYIELTPMETIDPRIKVSFSLDRNGIVHVEAEDTISKKKGEFNVSIAKQ